MDHVPELHKTVCVGVRSVKGAGEVDSRFAAQVGDVVLQCDTPLCRRVVRDAVRKRFQVLIQRHKGRETDGKDQHKCNHQNTDGDLHISLAAIVPFSHKNSPPSEFSSTSPMTAM